MSPAALKKRPLVKMGEKTTTEKSNKPEGRKSFNFQLSNTWQIMLVACAITFGLALFGQKITAGDGLGWYDGMVYSSWVKKFSGQPGGELNNWEIQRVVPSLIVTGMHKVIGKTPDNQSIPWLFGLWNAIMLCAVAWMWTLLAKDFKLSRNGLWLGFSTLFLSYCVWSHLMYYTTLTDATALALGMGMFCAYLRRQTAVLFGLTAVGGFTWPMAIYVGMLYLAFPRDSKAKSSGSKVPSFYTRMGISFVATCAVFALTYMVYNQPEIQARLDQIFFDWKWPVVSFLVTGLTFFYAFFCVLSVPTLWDGKYWRNAINFQNVFLCAVMYAGIRYIQSRLSVPAASGGESFYQHLTFIPGQILSGSLKPGIFMINHVLYFGPMMLGIYLFWRNILDDATKKGPAIFLMASMGCMFLLSIESRCFTDVLAFFVPFVIARTESLFKKPARMALAAACCLVFTRFWIDRNDPNAYSWLFNSYLGEVLVIGVTLGLLFSEPVTDIARGFSKRMKQLFA